MLQTNTHTISKILNAHCSVNIDFAGVFTDTRKRMDGGLFIALIGENFDAHDYIHQAEAMGAVAIVISKPIVSHLPTLLVNDTQTALANLAHWHLTNIHPKVVAITGSNGKTTTKNMLFNILRLHAPTLATKGNLNNHLGVPMTLLTLNTSHQYAVIEMGANHVGEIAHLCEIAPPDVAVVTNTGDAHIGEFGGFDNLVKTKGEIYHTAGQKIVNTNTDYVGDIRFGDNGDVFASKIDNNRFDLTLFNQTININLPLIGAHNIDNALAASACAHALGMTTHTIKQGLENTQAEAGRLTLIQQSDLTLIDDTYNASPTSMRAAIHTLLTFKGEKIAVLGDMEELGDEGIALHQRIGQLAKNSLDAVYTFGVLAQHYGGLHFTDMSKLARHIATHHPQATVLIKGSRAVKLDKLVKYLQK